MTATTSTNNQIYRKQLLDVSLTGKTNYTALSLTFIEDLTNINVNQTLRKILFLLSLYLPVLGSTSHLVKSFFAGSISGTCSTILFQPLDLLKTRLQLPDKTGLLYSRNRNILKLAACIVKEEAFCGLWRGLIPSLVRTVPGIGIYFTSLHYITRRFQTREPPPPFESLVMAACARSIAGLSTLPLTVLKTRYESGFFKYHSVLQGLSTIYRAEGYRGLFSGMSATLLRDVPFSALYFMFYTQMKSFMCAGNVDPSPLIYFSCGVSAGCLASVVTHPADVIKTHLQLNRVQTGDFHRTVLHIFKTHGIHGFLHGLLPRLLRRTLMAAMSWTVYEQLMKTLQLES